MNCHLNPLRKTIICLSMIVPMLLSTAALASQNNVANSTKPLAKKNFQLAYYYDRYFPRYEYERSHGHRTYNYDPHPDWRYWREDTRCHLVRTCDRFGCETVKRCW